MTDQTTAERIAQIEIEIALLDNGNPAPPLLEKARMAGLLAELAVLHEVADADEWARIVASVTPAAA